MHAMHGRRLHTKHLADAAARVAAAQPPKKDGEPHSGRHRHPLASLGAPLRAPLDVRLDDGENLLEGALVHAEGVHVLAVLQVGAATIGERRP